MTNRRIPGSLIAILRRIGRTFGRRYARRSHNSSVYVALERLENRELLAADFGDAPDRGRLTGVNDYQTLLSNNGPRHVIDGTISTLFMGRSVDGEAGSYQSVDSGLDDRSGTTVNVNKGVDDEDGIANPRELEATVGAQPVVNIRVTNLTSSSATLYGWLDANRNGVFDTPSERISVVVPAGTNGELVTLTFPQLQLSSVGTTYLRLRLSSDPAAANPAGSAVGGEVEDHRFHVRPQLRNTIRGVSLTGIADRYNGGPDINDRDFFGFAVTPVGDVNFDGINDLAVSAPFDGGNKVGRGAIYILLMNTNGRAKSSVKIGNKINGGPELKSEDHFGAGMASLGDLDGDGISELAVSAADDDTGGTDRGAIYILWLNKSGGAKKFVKLASGLSGMPQLPDHESLEALSSVGDLDGDGVMELAVGSPLGKRAGKEVGKVRILFLNANGTVKRSTEFFNPIAGSDVLKFGTEVVWLGDLNRDGATEVAVLSGHGTANSPYATAMDVISLNKDGTVQSAKRAIDYRSNFWQKRFRGVSSIGDINGDGINDIAFTQDRKLTFSTLNADGSIQSTLERDIDPEDKLDMESELDLVGGSTANLGDLNGDGAQEFVVGTPSAVLDFSRNTIFGAVLIASLKGVIPNRAKPSAPVPSVTNYPVDAIFWPVIDEAQSFELYVQNLTTKQIVATALSHTGDTFTPPSDWPMGQYSIKVRSKNEFGVSAWSKTQTLQYRPKPVIVSAPTEMIGLRPTVQWQPVKGAVRYTVKFDKTGFDVPDVEYSVDAATTQLTSPIDLTPGSYYIAVIAYGTDGTSAIAYSPLPANIGASSKVTLNDKLLDPRPIITWSSMPDATHYEVEILQDGQTVLTTTTTAARFQPSAALKSGAYTFRVRGVSNQAQFAVWSDKAFSILPPPSVLWNSESQTFKWYDTILTEQNEIWLQYPGEVPGTTVTETKVISRAVNWKAELRVPLDRLATIRMSIRAIGKDGEKGIWSPVVLGPVSYPTGHNTGVDFDEKLNMFTWKPMKGATKYKFIVFTSSYGTEPLVVSEVAVTRFPLNATLLKPGYYAKVTATGNDGTEGFIGWSKTF